MPIRPREINDQITEARIRQIVASMMKGETRRVGGGGGSGGGTKAEVFTFTANADWSIPMLDEPVISLWLGDSTKHSSLFDLPTFGSVSFDAYNTTPGLVLSGVTVSFSPELQMMTIHWGTPRTGTVTVLNHASGLGYSVIASAT